jgi:thiol-disulfide isomerase/thioredoxin
MGKRTQIRLQRKNQQKIKILVAAVTGLGLMLLAVALLMSPKNNAGSPSNTADTNGASTIPVAMNYAAPALSLENILGSTEALSDFRDKVVLVNNWATWCPPCKAEMPTLVAFYNDHARDGLMVVAIEAGESRDEVQKYVDQFQMPFHVWLDLNGASAAAFKNDYLPNSYVIDRSGTVRLTWTGQISRAMLDQYVVPLLSGN